MKNKKIVRELNKKKRFLDIMKGYDRELFVFKSIEEYKVFERTTKKCFSDFEIDVADIDTFNQFAKCKYIDNKRINELREYYKNHDKKNWKYYKEYYQEVKIIAIRQINYVNEQERKRKENFYIRGRWTSDVWDNILGLKIDDIKNELKEYIKDANNKSSNNDKVKDIIRS